jgi:hypothetical protein
MKQIDTRPTRETTTSTEPIGWETLEEFIRLQVEAQVLAESNFKPFDAAQLLRDVANGHQFADGQPKSDSRSLVA